jgi:hypothetical protein
VRTTKAIRCASCVRRIREHQTDVALEDLAGGGKRRYFHERCGGAAYALAMRYPAVYFLTVRHADMARN